MQIALDAMSGDNAPQAVVEGAALAFKAYPAIKFLFVGQTKVIEPLLSKYPQLKDISTILYAPDIVAAHDKPTVALRQGRHSSMRMAIDAVSEGIAEAVVSSGNTGAYMAISRFVLRPLKGMDRPAIAKAVPTLKGYSVALDLGANTECTAQNLLEFAIMGSIYARCVLGISRPTVGILNIGTEDIKGKVVVQEAAQLFKQHSKSIDFIGFVEGNDIAKGTVDVIVTDGFSGNIALKTMEGTAHLIMTFLKEAFTANLFGKIIGLCAKPLLSHFKRRIDPRRYNGAIFLGLNGIAIKSHGNTDALGFSYAIGVAYELAQHRAIESIQAALSEVMGPE